MPTSITTIQSTDLISASRTDINSNFASLNTNKIETSVIDTDSALAANSDSKIASQKAVKTYIDALGGQTYLVPTGAVLPYGGSSAPANFLLCDGSPVSRSTYATLFAIIGTTFGVGNGSTTFNVPDMRERVPVGAGAATKVATAASRSSNNITVTGITNAANNEFQTGQAVTYHTTGSVMTGLTNDTVYYVVRVSNLVFALASTLALAQAGTPISLSSDGTGVHTFTLSLTTRAVGDTGGEENHAMSSTELYAHTHTNNATQVKFQTNAGGTFADSSSGATGSSGGNAAMNNMQPFVGFNYIIKT